MTGLSGFIKLHSKNRIHVFQQRRSGSLRICEQKGAGVAAVVQVED